MFSLIQQLLIIGEQTFLYVPLVFGGYLAISLMQIPNLSIESAVLAGALAGALANKTCGNMLALDLVVGLLFAALAGVLVGIGAGLLHVYGKLSHLLSSIIMLGFCHGLSLLIMGGSHLTLNSENNPLRLFPYIATYPALLVLMGIGSVISLVMVFFLKTKLGITCAFYGDNPQFLTSHKISSAYVVCVGLGIANGLAGISGYLLANNNGFIDMGMATGVPLLCVTALMLGNIVRVNIKSMSVALPLVGILAYFILQALLLQAGFDLRYFPLVQAVLLTGIFLTQRSRNNHMLGV